MKKINLLVSLLLIISVCLLYGCKSKKEVQYISESSIVFNEETLINKSDYIVTGKIIDMSVKNLIIDEHNNEEPFSFYTFRVKKNLKGNFEENKTINVVIRGDGESVISNNILKSGGYFKKDDHALLFMNNPDEESIQQYKKNYNKDVDFYLLTSSLQGRIWLNDDFSIDTQKDSFNTLSLKKIKDIEDVELKINNIK